MIPLEDRIAIPLYGSWLLLSVSDDPVRARKNHKEFGPVEGERCKYATAIASSKDGDFGLFFSAHDLKHSTIAHEIFHTTMNVMEFHAAPFSAYNQEPHAYLNGWISQWVYFKLSCYKIPVI